MCVGLGGFEPPLTESKSVVLPLHNRPVYFLFCGQDGTRTHDTLNANQVL